MKKRQRIKNVNPYAGLAQTTASRRGDVLTPKKLKAMFDYIASDEYAEVEHERMRFRAIGKRIAGRALAMELITELEYLDLLMIISINGGLIVSKRMYDKILPAAEALEEESN